MSDPVFLAALIALAVSVSFGLASHIQHIALDRMDAHAGTLVNVATSTIMFWALAPFYLVPGTLATPPVVLFVAAGLIVPAFSITLSTLSVKTIGPGLTSGLAATSPVFAMAIAVLFLGEVVSAPILAGTLTVIAGIMLIALRSHRTGVAWPLWALGLPLAAALCRGVSHPLIKLGLTGLPSPMTAALVTSTVSLAVLSVIHLMSGRRLPAWNPGYLWFALCGIINGVGIIGLAVALGLGEVVTVSPLVATTPAFTLLMGRFIFRRETIAWSSIAAIALIFTGVVLILTR